MNAKEKALRVFFNIPDDQVIIPDVYQDNLYAVGTAEYLVLTEKEADEYVKEDIMQSLWAFNAEFILHHSNNNEMSNWEWDNAVKALKEIQGEYCEGINGLVRALIIDIDEFVKDAVAEDGRGHFLAYYDGDEDEQRIDGVTYYIYRRD